VYYILSVQIENVTYSFKAGVGVSGFHIILVYSLPRYDLQLHVKYRYTIIRLNTQNNVLINQVSLVITLFQLHSSGTQSIGWCAFYHSNVSSSSSLFTEFIEKLPSCLLNLLLRSSFACISESQDVSCWGCNANSTHLSIVWEEYSMPTHC